MSGSAQARKAQSSSAKERVTAVVVTYNRKALLRQCLDALQAQTHVLDQIIVVDNASTDGTPAMVRDVYPEVKLMELEENRGGAGGFHTGMKRATEQEVDWIWVMDDDAEPESDALEKLFHPGVHREEETAALASMRVNPDGSIQTGSAGWYDPFSMKYDLTSIDGPPCEQIGYATFVGLMIRARAVKAIGLPEQGYFIRADDNEYVLRLSREGQVYLVRDSRVVHHDASASKKTPKTLMGRMVNERPIRSYWRKYYGLRNKLLIVRAHAQTPLEKWYGYAIGFKNLVRGALAVVVFDDYKLLRLKVLFLGFMHGLIGKSGKCVDPDDFLKKRVEV